MFAVVQIYSIQLTPNMFIYSNYTVYRFICTLSKHPSVSNSQRHHGFTQVHVVLRFCRNGNIYYVVKISSTLCINNLSLFDNYVLQRMHDFHSLCLLLTLHITYIDLQIDINIFCIDISHVRHLYGIGRSLLLYVHIFAFRHKLKYFIQSQIHTH